MHEMSKYPLNRCTDYLEHVLYWFISDKLAWGKVRELQTDLIHPYLSFGNTGTNLCVFIDIRSFFKMSRVGTLYIAYAYQYVIQ